MMANFALGLAREQEFQVAFEPGWVVASAVALDRRAVQNPLDPLTHARCGFRLVEPDRLQQRHYVNSGHLVDRLVDDRRCIGRNGRAPLLAMLNPPSMPSIKSVAISPKVGIR